MWAITSKTEHPNKNNNNRRRRYSVQWIYTGIFFIFIALMMVLLNTYPTISSRNVVFASKQSLMVGQASVMASSLSALERLYEENVESVMELVDVNSFDRVLVTDDTGLTLYDTDRVDNARGKYALFYEIRQALQGQVEFRCRYDGVSFRSRTATPVVSNGDVIGAVYLYETDSDQASLIKGIQQRLRSISLVSGFVALVAIVLFTKALTRRITDLVGAVRTVREGNLAYRITPRGWDEVTELSEEFNAMAQRLQNTEEVRRRFVSDASHELRTPLTSIRLLADSIVQSEGMDEEMMREFVTDIGTEAERLSRMTDKLMRLSKMDRREEVAAQVVDVRKVVERSMHMLQPLSQTRNVTLFPDLQAHCAVYANEDDLHQIIFNLTENAIKYNSFGGNIFLHLYIQDGQSPDMPGTCVILDVEDTGIGIPEEDMPYIFDRFYRVDKARSSEVGGSGLGLSIVRDAVERNGGSIQVRARETVGTCFTVTFPAASPEKGDAP